MPIARLLQGTTGDVSFDHTFVPPLLDLAASDMMTAMMRRLVERLSARSASLAGSRRQRNTDLADFSVADVGSFWLLYTVNTHLPALRHLHEVRRGHPSALWEAMLALVGALSAFATSADARTLPSYDHLRLGECFAELERRLFELLDGAVVDAAVSLPLKPVRPTLHAVAAEQAAWLDAPQWFLAVSAPLRREPIVKVMQGCKWDRLTWSTPSFVRRCPIELAHVSAPPPAVPVSSTSSIRDPQSGWCVGRDRARPHSRRVRTGGAGGRALRARDRAAVGPSGASWVVGLGFGGERPGDG